MNDSRQLSLSGIFLRKAEIKEQKGLTGIVPVSP